MMCCDDRPSIAAADLALLKQTAVLHERSRLRREQVPIFRSALSPILEQETAAARRVLDRTTPELDAWVEEFFPEQQERVEEALAPLVETYGEDTVALVMEEIGTDVTPAALEVFAQQYATGLAVRWTNDSVAQIRQIQRDEEDVEEAMRQRLDAWEESRAQRMAEREATQAAGAFAVHAMVAAGIRSTVWRAVGESCPLCTRMDGRTVSVTRPFMSPGDTLEAEDETGETLRFQTQQRLSHPPLHGAGKRGGVCDCLVSPG